MKATRIAERERMPKSVVNQEKVVVYLHHLDNLEIHVVEDGLIDTKKEASISVEADRKGCMYIDQRQGSLTVNFNG